jgi:hypothetical protein
VPLADGGVTIASVTHCGAQLSSHHLLERLLEGSVYASDGRGRKPGQWLRHGVKNSLIVKSSALCALSY